MKLIPKFGLNDLQKKYHKPKEIARFLETAGIAVKEMRC